MKKCELVVTYKSGRKRRYKFNNFIECLYWRLKQKDSAKVKVERYEVTLND